jgi:hypothetical protein
MFSTSQIAREFTGVGGMSLGRPRTLSGRIQDLHFDIQSRLDRLLSIHSRLELFHTEISEQQLLPPGPLEHLERIISRFHTVARQLRSRYNDRPTLDVTDEYDVQNLLHALLRLFFDDIRPEEWTPSYAGGASRMDFLLRNEQVVVETKKTRPRLRAKEVADQLIIDIRRYKEHPHCHTLVCFVYDPDELIANPDGLEGDLSQPSDGLSVRVFVRPKRR